MGNVQRVPGCSRKNEGWGSGRSQISKATTWIRQPQHSSNDGISVEKSNFISRVSQWPIPRKATRFDDVHWIGRPYRHHFVGAEWASHYGSWSRSTPPTTSDLRIESNEVSLVWTTIVRAILDVFSCNKQANDENPHMIILLCCWFQKHVALGAYHRRSKQRSMDASLFYSRKQNSMQLHESALQCPESKCPSSLDVSIQVDSELWKNWVESSKYHVYSGHQGPCERSLSSRRCHVVKDSTGYFYQPYEIQKSHGCHLQKFIRFATWQRNCEGGWSRLVWGQKYRLRWWLWCTNFSSGTNSFAWRFPIDQQHQFGVAQIRKRRYFTKWRSNMSQYQFVAGTTGRWSNWGFLLDWMHNLINHIYFEVLLDYFRFQVKRVSVQELWNLCLNAPIVIDDSDSNKFRPRTL